VKDNRDPESILFIFLITSTILPSPFIFFPLTSRTHPSFGVAGNEHEKLVYNDATFLLAMAITDGALFGFESLDDLKKQENPPG
jgi:hypothetical protein